jgi:type I restriction enzyme S subunit
MSEWKTACLADICDIIPSNVDKKIYANEMQVLLCNYMDVYKNRYLNSQHIFNIGSVNSQEWDRFHLIRNDVLITKDSETPDDIAVPAVILDNIENLVCGYHLAMLRPKGQINGSFLMNLLQLHKVNRQFANTANGITRYGLTKSAICNVKIEYPNAIAEQYKIARILFTVDSIIEQTQATIAKYTAIKKGMMHDLLTRGIDLKTGKLRPKYDETQELYRKTELGYVPKDWGVTSLNECAVKIADRDHYTPKYVESGIPMISPKDFDSNDNICFTKCSFVSTEEYEHNMKKTDIKPGDLVFTRIGALLGKVCIVTPEMPAFSILHSASMIRANPKVIMPEYLCYFIKSPFFQRQIAREIQSIGVPDLGLEKIGAFKVAHPNEIKEQQEIALKLKGLFIALQHEQQFHDKERRLKQALMSVLLTGRKRVKVEET